MATKPKPIGVVCPACTGDGCAYCNHAARVSIFNRDRWPGIRWEQIKSAFVDETHAAMMRDMAMRQRYAYVRPSSVGAFGELFQIPEGDEIPSGCELVHAERIPSGNKDQIRLWLERFAGRLPVFPL